MNKIKLSKEVDSVKFSKKFILEFFSKTEATPQTIAFYCSTVGMPLVPTYYFLITENKLNHLESDFYRLCEFYNIEVDLCL